MEIPSANQTVKVKGLIQNDGKTIAASILPGMDGVYVECKPGTLLIRGQKPGSVPFFPYETVLDLKEHIFKKTGISPEAQFLTWQAHPLQDTDMLSTRKISNGQTIILTARTAGG
jgi:hypothetical protein